MPRVVDSGAVIHYVFGCLFLNSAISTDGVSCAPYFVQPVLLLAPDGGHFSDDPSSSDLSMKTLIILSGQAFLLSRHTPGKFVHGSFPPSGSLHDGGIRRVTVLSEVFLICCSSFLGLFACHLIPHYPAVALTPGEGYLVPFIMKDSKEV